MVKTNIIFQENLTAALTLLCLFPGKCKQCYHKTNEDVTLNRYNFFQVAQGRIENTRGNDILSLHQEVDEKFCGNNLL